MKTTLNPGESLIFNGTRLSDVHSFDLDTKEVTFFERDYRTGEKIPDALDPTGFRTLTEAARTLEIEKPVSTPAPDYIPDSWDPQYMGCQEQRALHQLRWDFIELLPRLEAAPYGKETAEKIAYWAADILSCAGQEHYQVQTQLIDYMDWAAGVRSYYLTLRAVVPNVPRLRLHGRLRSPGTADPSLHRQKFNLSAGAFEGLDLEPQIVRIPAFGSLVQK